MQKGVKIFGNETIALSKHRRNKLADKRVNNIGAGLDRGDLSDIPVVFFSRGFELCPFVA